MYAGVLATDDTIITTCEILVERTGDAILAMVHTSEITAIGSNGDWVNDPERQSTMTDYVFLGSHCVGVAQQYYVELGAAVLLKPFSKTLYINALANRVVMKTAAQWKKVILKILGNAHCDRMIRGKCVRRDFEIAGFICPDGKCSKDSPMFKMVTHLLQEEECYQLICANNSCKDFTKKTLQSTGTLCFPTDGIGGPGSPVTFERVMVAVGNFVKRDHLIATRFDKGWELIDVLFSTANRILGQFSMLQSVLCTLIIGHTTE